MPFLQTTANTGGATSLVFNLALHVDDSVPLVGVTGLGPGPRQIAARVTGQDAGGAAILTADSGAVIGLESIDVVYLANNASVPSSTAIFDDDADTILASEALARGRITVANRDYTVAAGVLWPGVNVGAWQQRAVVTDPAVAALQGVVTATTPFNLDSVICLNSGEVFNADWKLFVSGGAQIGSTFRCQGVAQDVTVLDCDTVDCSDTVTVCPGGFCTGAFPADAADNPIANDPATGTLHCEATTPTTSFTISGGTCADKVNVGAACVVTGGNLTLQWGGSGAPTDDLVCSYATNVAETVDLTGDADGQGLSPGTVIDLECDAGCAGSGSLKSEFTFGLSSPD